MTEISLHDPRRSASGAIRGYLYQVCLGVLRWLELGPGELLLLEGDEDLDRILRGERSCEQVKYRSHDIGLRDPAIAKSLITFVKAFAELQEGGEQRRFVFTTNAAVRACDAKLIADWNEPQRQTAVVAAIKGAIAAKAADAVQWLDGEEGRWPAFVGAVEWRFETGSVEDLMGQIRDRLRRDPITRQLDPGVLGDRLVVEILNGSSLDRPGLRLRDRAALDRVVATTSEELGQWARSPDARGLRTAVEELAELNKVLRPGARPRPAGLDNPGSLLRAEYQVIPFYEPGRLTELGRLAAWCEDEARASVWLLTGGGGFGKTRLLIEWCQRLARQGWHTGFLSRDLDRLDRLFAGTTPRLGVVDYAKPGSPRCRTFSAA